MRALAVIDGEHYAPVVRDALSELPYDFVAAFLVGGTEKLREGADYGLALTSGLEEAVERHGVELVVDLSDEPVLGPRERFRLASEALALGLRYEGPGFRFDPPEYLPCELPSLAVAGTGKRVGKTAVTTYAARLLARDRRVVVVAMGRGGPPEPELVEARPTPSDLLRLVRAGRHAASDYLEIAALAGVPTVGCRRCGGGLAGAPATCNVEEGISVAARLEPDLVIFDGSGAALPPVDVDARVLVVGAHQPPDLVTGYLNTYRILVSDLVVVTMARPDGAHEPLCEAIRAVKPDLCVVSVELLPRPVEPVSGRRVAYFTTAGEKAHSRLADHLEAEHGAEVVHVSGNLASRPELVRELVRVEAEVYLVEIKAAAIDVVAEHGRERGVDVIFVDNELAPLPGEPDVDDALRALAGRAPARVAS